VPVSALGTEGTILNKYLGDLKNKGYKAISESDKC
jgi:hypothetical protein